MQGGVGPRSAGVLQARRSEKAARQRSRWAFFTSRLSEAAVADGGDLVAKDLHVPLIMGH